MLVSVTRLGGLAGIPLRAQLDTAELGRVGAAVDAALAALKPGRTGPAHPDAFQYQLEFDGRCVTLAESAVPHALQPLLDAAARRGTLG